MFSPFREPEANERLPDYQITQLPDLEGFWRQDERFAEAERRQV